jgi:hypothetical protein
MRRASRNNPSTPTRPAGSLTIWGAEPKRFVALSGRRLEFAECSIGLVNFVQL